MSYSVETDRKWQKKWADMGLYTYDMSDAEDKLYVLEMFSYPSGANLHVGHWYNYSLSDSYARMKRMQGAHVFQPMGFDAFGLPAENYAIKTGIHPMDSTHSNIATMEKQLMEMGGMFAWDHELATCEPEYYRWNQWLFLQLYKNGLAYRKNAPVNWCPDCQTVLANEQVVDDGHCERCGAEVTHKNLTQWFFKITDYAQELLDKLPDLDWPDKTKKIQQNWIGRSEGSELRFTAVKDGQPVLDEQGNVLPLDVFTTRADTVMGVTYIVVAPESELCDRLTTDDQRSEMDAYIEQTRKFSDIDRMAVNREKTGRFTGSYAVHPVTGEQLPIWAADYVIAGYGTGVVMAVPGHDERDHAFAVKYNLPIQRVITANDGSETELPYTEYGRLVNSGEFDGLTSEEALNQIVDFLSQKGLGSKKINYRLKDWLVSRQRYWGTPIPIIYCDDCGTVPVPEDQLPVRLPYDVEFKPDGKSPLSKSEEFVHTTCPVCGKPATRDVDTLDTFVCSSWYQFRYIDPKNEQKPFDSDLVNKFGPVDVYIGGAEHAAMHLLYSRFITKVLRDLGYLNFDEPFLRLIHQGTILGSDGQKMSKSRGNTVSPDKYIAEYGSDIFRLYLAFGFAYTEGGPWSDDGVKAIAKLVARIERLVEDVLAKSGGTVPETANIKVPDTPAAQELQYARHFAIRGVTIDAEKFQFNTSIARIMEYVSALIKYSSSDNCDLPFFTACVEDLLLITAPFAPHFVDENWELLGHTDTVFNAQWPQYDEAALILDTVEIALQVNGKIVDRIDIPSDAAQDDVRDLALANESVIERVGDKKIVKFIFVPGRLANLVVK